ncbi:MAG: acetoin utilization protein AcuC [Thermoplasmata archaeon]|nr:acetoin utilization protein AcuC [Thermoplasmata archaeon]
MVYSDDYLQYDFKQGHPLNQTRLKLGFQLMKSCGIIDRDDVKVFEPPPADDDKLLLAHDKAYVDYVRKVSQNVDEEFHRFGLGPGDNPAFEGLYDAARIHVGGTVLACDRVMQKDVDHAFSIGGGYHHAHKDRASGFCVFNDPAVGIRHLQKEYGLERVLYVDIDAHHGDGVQWIFFDDPSVMTISMHESGRFLFPGTGFVEELGKNDAKGTKVNIPLPMNTTDKAYLYAFNEVVVPLVKSFKPQFMIAQCGGDSHYSDPITHLSLTTRSYKEIAKMYHDLSHELDFGLVCVTGGGYDLIACPRIWTLMVSQLCGATLDQKIPEDFIELCKSTLGYEPPANLEDDEMKTDDADRVFAVTKEVVKEVKEHIFPFHKV